MSNTLHHVVEVNAITAALFELVLERNQLVFTPGDCVAIFTEDNSDSRPYSIASGTGEPVLRFLIRRMPDGRLSSYLSNLSMGAPVVLSPVFGWFRPGQDCGDADSVFVATGTGIAPFLSYSRSFPEAPPRCCLYGVRQLDEAAGLEDLRDHANCHLCVSQESVGGLNGVFSGRVTDHLDKVPLDMSIHYYLCGLDAMIYDVSNWLDGRGIDFFNIHREVFFNDRKQS